jgi:hypothetical protein
MIILTVLYHKIVYYLFQYMSLLFINIQYKDSSDN